MSITTIARSTVILLVFVLNTVGAQSVEDGRRTYNEGDYATALEVFRSLAVEGDIDAQNNLGVMYFNGEGIPRDYSEAMRGTPLEYSGHLIDHGKIVGRGVHEWCETLVGKA